MNKRLLTITLLLFMALTISPACKAPEEPSEPTTPARFEVMFLDITPPEVAAGETVSITAKVKNISSNKGTYTATLTVGGIALETKDITIDAGATKTVTFSLMKNKPGTYKVAVGELSSSLTVKLKEKEPVFITKEAELKYDDSRAEIVVASPGGYLVDFYPPSTQFTIKKVRICGMLYGSGREADTFDLEIWDEDRKILYNVTYPVTKFPTGYDVWVDFDIPDTETSDKFYVHIYRGGHIVVDGLCIGADDSVVNEHSNVTIRAADGVAHISEWPFAPTMWIGDKSKVNWMIRVAGTYIVPEE